jgi:hypothetical protein
MQLACRGRLRRSGNSGWGRRDDAGNDAVQHRGGACNFRARAGCSFVQARRHRLCSSRDRADRSRCASDNADGDCHGAEPNDESNVDGASFYDERPGTH